MSVRIGIIGSGAITRRAYLPGFSRPGSPNAAKAHPYFDFGGCEGAEVVALCNPRIERARNLAEEFQIPTVFEDWRELLSRDDIDAVCINTPNAMHAEMTIAAAEAGKHVMVEKPMAASIQEADAMVKAARENRVLLMVDQTQRFWPVHETAQAILRSGAIGRVISVRGKMAHGGPQFWNPQSTWFASSVEGVHGALFDIGIHTLDLMRFLIGEPVKEVAAFTTKFRGEIEVEDNAVAILRFASGATGVLEASWTCNPRESSIYIYGEFGNIRIGHSADEPIFVEYALPDSAQNREIPAGRLSYGRHVPEIPKRSRLGGPFRHFVESVEKNVQPTPSGEDGRSSLEVVLAAFASARDRSVVELPLER